MIEQYPVLIPNTWLACFLVNKSPSWIDSLKHLTYKYISNQNTRGSVFRRDRDTSQWNQVNKGSRHWKEAHGWSYFHLPMNLTSRVGMALLRHSGNYAWRRIRLERESVHKQNTAQEEPVWGDRHSQGMLSADELCWFCTLPLLREASHFVKQHTWFNTVMYSASFCTPTTLTLASIKQKIFQFRENCVCKCNFWIKFWYYACSMTDALWGFIYVLWLLYCRAF